MSMHPAGGSPLAPPTPPPGRKPSWWWFVVAGALALAGIIGAAVFGVLSFMRVDDKVAGFDRVDVPGSITVRIDEPGERAIYHEYPGADGDVFAPRPTIELTDPAGRPVAIASGSATVSYSFSGFAGTRIGTFEAVAPGDYTLRTEDSRGTAVAVGEGIGRDIAVGIVGAILIAVLGLLSGAVLAIVTGVRLVRHRTRSRRGPRLGTPPGQAL